MYLGDAPAGKLRMGELADRLLLSRSGITRLVDRLARQGLIERERCEDDGRGYYARLTPLGRETLAAIAATTDARGTFAPTTVLRTDRAALGQWLAPAPGRALEDHLYLVDPRGDWMMRVPVDADPARLKRDIDKLLRASASWDRPGR